MQAASENLAFEQAAAIRDRLKALAHITSRQGINVSSIDDADVVALAQDGGQACVQVFFYRGGRNYGNRAYYPSHAQDAGPDELLEAFLGQFYSRADRAAPRAGEPHAGLAGPARRGAVAARAAPGRAVAAAARRAPPADRPGRDQRPPCAGPPARREQLAGHAAAPPRRSPGPARAARADRDLRQQPHHGHAGGRRVRGRRPRGPEQGRLSQVHHPRRGSHAGRRLRHDARGAAAPVHPPAARGCRAAERPVAGSRGHRRRRRPALGGAGDPGRAAA